MCLYRPINGDGHSMDIKTMIDIKYPEVLVQIKADYFENNGPLSKEFSACGWTSGMTSPIDIVDRDAFRDFLKNQGVTYKELDDSFLLYSANLQRWPESNTGSIESEEQFVVREDETDGVDRDPFVFWRAVSRFLAPNTYFRVIKLGYVGYAPWVFDCETSYFAMAMTVAANGSIIIQNFEDYFVNPIS